MITNNKAWETATPVRREYVTELVARRSVPKGTLRYVTEVIMADPGWFGRGQRRRGGIAHREGHQPWAGVGSDGCAGTCQ